MFSEEDLGRIEGMLQLAHSYEDRKLRAPEVKKCSHSTRLVLSREHFYEVQRYGTITLPPAAVIELIENLKERGN